MATTAASLLRLLLLPALALAISAIQPLYNIETNNNCTEFIRTRCSTTLYPRRCYASLARYAVEIQDNPTQLASVAVSVSLRRARHESEYLSSLHRNSSGRCTPRVASALGDCASTIGEAVDQMKQSEEELPYLKTGKDFLWHMNNVQTWMSAALTNEETCTDGFEDLPPSDLKDDICARVCRIKEVTSNALALVNSLASDHHKSPSEDLDFDRAGVGI